jgi:hypothetical protein
VGVGFVGADARDDSESADAVEPAAGGVVLRAAQQVRRFAGENLTTR